MLLPNRHAWVIVESGEWFTEFVCKKCKEVIVVEPEDNIWPPRDNPLGCPIESPVTNFNFKIEVQG